ncbi:MAG: NAD(P)/FAD-dependent oxidoreductase [Phycisphaerales bacterium]
MTSSHALSPSTPAHAVIIGAGASGLMTAISIGRALESAGVDPKSYNIVLLDGAKKIGIKILVAGGGRCNVTHHAVDEHQYATTKPAIVRSTLKRFSADDSINFFHGLGVELKLEDTGKMFPVTDSAHTVLDALLAEVRRLGIRIMNPCRVESVTQSESSFVIHSQDPDQVSIHAEHLVLAVGGKALPKSGSDGQGYSLAHALGHSVTDYIFPALVPLVADQRSQWIRELSGISARASISVLSSTNKRLKTFTNDLLCTHFGLSGPGPMDISRFLTDAKRNDRDTRLEINWVPSHTFESIDQELTSLGKQQVSTYLRSSLPERLARALCEQCEIDPTTPGNALTREHRRALAHLIVSCPVYIQSDRGFTHAEVTAGGVPIEEVNRKNFASKKCQNLWLVGEILDIDGRIGGFNFQWAWSTGFIAGNSIAKSMIQSGLLPEQSNLNS